MPFDENIKRIPVTSRELFGLVTPYFWRVIAAIGFSLGTSAASGAIVWLLKPVTNSIFMDKNQMHLKWLPWAVVGIFFVRGFCQMVYCYLMRSAGLKLVRDLRIRLYDRLLYVPVSSFSKESSGRMISRLLNDTAILSALVSNTLLNLLKEVPTVIVLLGVALYRRWDVTLLALIVLPGIAAAAQRFGKIIKGERKHAQITMANLTHRIGEAISGNRVIKIFLREREMVNRFSEESHSNYRKEVKIVKLKELAKLVTESSTGIGAGIVIGYGGYLVVKGIITTGDLFSALGAIIMIFSPVKKLGGSYASFQEIKGAMERIKWLEAMPREKSGGKHLDKFRKEISFENVSHRYEAKGDLVLRDINLTIKKGETLAVVGHSGAGKTTFVDLIPRFYDPTCGVVRMDGTDLRELDVIDVRRQIGLVSQEIVLFNDTVRSNIAFGNPDASQEEIEDAARRAYAHDFIRELPRGYDTMLGERGLNLSGGERQRIAIARAILKDPPILILDEATSALDSVSENLVQMALNQLMSNRTTVVVAHRLSTIRNADSIVVMERGRMMARGTHEDLMETSPVYKALYHSFSQDNHVVS